MTETSIRTRDPERREKILVAAADLVARHGYHAVSMADIGTESGITGSGVYRHFESKASILVAIFERVIDELLADEATIIESTDDIGAALLRLIDDQVEFVVGKRSIARVYHHEITNLPDEDRRRLRRKQRIYLEEWVHLVRELQPGVDDSYARTLVHAAISAIQSTLFHNVGLPEDRLRQVLADSAVAVLGVGPPTQEGQTTSASP